MCAAAREWSVSNLFLPHLAPHAPGTKLSNFDYARVSEELVKVGVASEVPSCAAPDTGNMTILNLSGSDSVKRDRLNSLLEDEIESAFSRTEPDISSSDATNIRLPVDRQGDEFVLNGTKWSSCGH